MTAATAPSTAPERVPSVLVLLVVRDAAAWLRECLQALAAQTYPRVGVLAIDDLSGDGSSEILTQALGEGRVVRTEGRLGFADAFALGAAHPAAAAADHLLLLHDDAVLDPDAIARLVEATQLPGVDRVGIVGGKVVDHDDPRVLRDVGRSADRFGHPYTPLQAGEIDQGQFDRVLDVLSADGCALLVAREAHEAVGLFDERLEDHGDLDLCWRARVAGFRVLMTPLARIRHRAAGEVDDRPDASTSHRHGEDRAALATIAKNYGALTLLWVIPLDILLSFVRLLYLTLSRRFEEASELIGAYAWNVARLPGTLRRRRRVQRSRAVPDRSLRRFTESAGLRLPRWFRTAELLLEEQRELDAEEEGQPVQRRLRHRTASLFSTHPVLVTSSIALIVGGFAVRHLIGPDVLAGGALPAFPETPGGFLAELVSGYRTSGLGGTLGASPALGAMGGLSFLLLGSTGLAQKVMLAGSPVLAAILAYRACVRWTSSSSAAAVAAAAYVLSGVVLWAYSDGRIATLAVLVVMPPLLERTATAFAADDPPEGRRRFTAGLGVTLAAGAAFEPGVLLAFALVVVVHAIAGGRRRAGLAAAALAAVAAAVLLFPFVPTMTAGGGAALGSFVGEPDPWGILRLVLGPGPGSWVLAAFLPLAAVAGLALARDRFRAPAARLAAVALASLGLAWLGAAGYLPRVLTNPEVFVALAAAAESVLVAIGIVSIAGGVRQESFGLRQIAAALLTVFLALGIAGQAFAAMFGGWAVGGPTQVTAAWAVVDSTATGRFRVLWIGDASGLSFPAPGGDPVAEVRAGGTRLRYQLTDRSGALAIDTGRSLTGPGAEALDHSIAEILAGGSVHGGALLAPFGVRFVVANPADLSQGAAAAFEAQGDLNRIPSSGLVIWRNAVTLDVAVVTTPTPDQRTAIEGTGPATTQLLTPMTSSALGPVEGGWNGVTGGGTDVLLSTEFDGAWGIEGSDEPPQRSFGWATHLLTTAPAVAVRFGGQLPATIAAWLLAAVWAVALWVTRKPVHA